MVKDGSRLKGRRVTKASNYTLIGVAVNTVVRWQRARQSVKLAFYANQPRENQAHNYQINYYG